MSKVTITVNGEEHSVDPDVELVHTDIAKLGYGEDIMDKPHAKYMSCVYSAKIPGGRLEGMPYSGGAGVKPVEGMHFTIMDTGNA